MRAFLLRWCRVAASLFRIGAQIRSIVMRLFAIAAAWVGIGAFTSLIVGWGGVLRWIVAEDWTHAALVFACSVLFSALLALYGHERTNDELSLNGVRVTIECLKAVILPTYAYSQANVFRDVLSVTFRLAFENHSIAAVTPHISKVELQHKRRYRWQSLPYDLGGPSFSPIAILTRRVPPRDEVREPFHFHACLPGGASSYSHQSMRLLLEIRVPGQPDVRKSIPFAPVPEIKPPADPAPTTAPEQSPPSSPESSG